MIAPSDSSATPAGSLFYRPTEVAALLGCTRQTVFNRLKAGLLPSVKVGGHRLIPKSALESLTATDS
jgi:excisionase family DNA binding protein